MKPILRTLAASCWLLSAGSGLCAPGTASDLEPIKPIEAPFKMPQLQRPTFPNRSWSVADFSAVGNGRTLNTNAIQRAIDTCSQAGGGRVIVPSGRWLTVPIELKSGVDLHLEAGAELVFTDEKKHYFPDPTSPRKGDGKNRLSGQSYAPEMANAFLPKPLISASGCRNIAITGPGKLDGQGLGWWPLHQGWWEARQREYPQAVHDHAWQGLDASGKYERPPMIHPVNCRNVLLEGFTISNGPFWMIHPLACENLIVRKVTVRSAGPARNPHSPNTDGINPESCKNVLIEDCDIDTGDDSVAIKSGLDEAGRKRGLPSQNIVIRHCRLRRIAIGSEMSGGVRNVLIQDCDVSGMSSCIHIKSRRGRGGIVENIWVQDLRSGVCNSAVLQLDMEYWTQYIPAPLEPVSERTPKFRNIHFKNITSDRPSPTGRAIYLNGLPEMPMENLTFENIDIASQGGMVCHNARKITFKKVTLRPQQGPVLALKNCQGISLSDCEFPDSLSPWLELKGKDTRRIRLDSPFSALKDRILLGEDAPANAVVYQE